MIGEEAAAIISTAERQCCTWLPARLTAREPEFMMSSTAITERGKRVRRVLPALLISIICGVAVAAHAYISAAGEYQVEASVVDSGGGR